MHLVIIACVTYPGYKNRTLTYKHTDLPHGKDLLGEPLKNTLTSLFSEYATDIVVNKLSCCANSQKIKVEIVPLQQKTRKPSTIVEAKVVTLKLHVE